MSVSVSQDNLLSCLKESGLLSGEEFDRAARALLSSSDTIGESPAQKLVDAGLLTPFQMEAVSRGAFSELRIGNYDVLDRLGAGGMGTVFKARHRRMKRIVALKVLSRAMAQDATFLQRFQREVETIARLSHPNIVMAFDADEAEAGPFLVMEFVNGPDLTSVVQKQGALNVSMAVECILQAARGLEYAHGQGIIHRDIKPANLMRDASGVVKVTDLGLARFSALAGGPGQSPGSAITQAGGIVGTVDYMPPEQSLDPGSIDHRADIYSLGATLHYLLFGQPPYQGASLMATLLKHREAPIPSLTQARKDVPAELDAVFRRMEAKVPADRYQTMTEVVGALESVQDILARRVAETIEESGVGGQESGQPSHTSGEPKTGVYSPSQEPATGVWESSASAGRETTLVAAQADTAQTIVPETPAPSSVSTADLKVVLVEPSRTQSGIIRKYLQGQGVKEVIAAASGQEALAAVGTERPHAVVSALHLPDMTGVQLAQKIRGQINAGSAASPTPPPGFVLISSESESSQAGTLSGCGKAVLLQKPFTPEKLVEALKVVISPVSEITKSVAAPSESGKATPCDAELAPAAKSKLGLLRVLIVDDSSPARLHIRGVLEGLGLMKFVEAPDGARAVAAVAKDVFDLIVTDYNMPYMDGRGLVAFLKQNPATASVPIIMVTTETNPNKLESVRQLGVTVCDKSFQRDVVRKIIDQLTGGSHE
jgi:serine/threonine protein kinase/DNA-binding response OmpR family regulator